MITPVLSSSILARCELEIANCGSMPGSSSVAGIRAGNVASHRRLVASAVQPFDHEYEVLARLAAARTEAATAESLHLRESLVAL